MREVVEPLRESSQRKLATFELARLIRERAFDIGIDVHEVSYPCFHPVLIDAKESVMRATKCFGHGVINQAGVYATVVMASRQPVRSPRS